MLRRRILASAMASVMAIGSIAAVASAEDTAVATANVKTRDDLAAYVKSFDKFRETEIYDYGSLAGEDFLDALEYADNVLADSSSTTIDYTVAYSMVESVYTELLKHKYTADQLKDLIKKYQKDYDTNNILNDELGDNRWSPESFSKFETAFDDATAVASSSDSRIITDAYEELEDKHSKLSALTAVTKKDFRTALKAYETALQKEFAYDSWRRGTIKNSGWQFDGMNVAYGLIYNYVASANDTINAKYEILDQIKELNTTTQTDIVDAYNDCVLATSVLNGFTADDTNRATKANVKTLMNTYHGRLVYDYNTTAAVDLYAEIVKKVGKTNIHNKTGDNYSYTIDKKKAALASTDSDIWYITGGSKLNSAELTIKSDKKFYIALDADGFALGVSLNDSKTETQLLSEANNTTYTAAGKKMYYTTEAGVVKDEKTGKVVKTVDAGTLVREEDWGYCIDGTWETVVTAAGAKVSVEPAMSGFAGATSFKLVNAGTTVDLTSYVDVTTANVAANLKPSAVDNHGANGTVEMAGETDKGHVKSATWDDDGIITNSSGDTVRTFVTLDNAFKVAENYLDAKNDDDYAASGIIVAGNDKTLALDTISALDNKTLKGSSTEWTLVYRNLKYALSDKYDSTTCNHTKKNVEELIEKAYDLAEQTGDAALFEYNHNLLVDARQAALDWVKAANKIKTYKDNVTSVEVGTNSFIADQVYHTLEGYYNTLKDEYENFKYSFGEIYDYINEVKTMIDDGKLTATDALVKKLADASYYLSTVESLTVKESKDNKNTWSDEYTFLDNDAFTSDRMFQEFNRVFTFSKNDPSGYTFQYKADTWLQVLGVKDYSGNPNINYSHFQLKTAYEDLQLEVKAQLEPDVKLGDVNGDGKVDALDAAAILIKIAAGETVDAKVGDYNADGAVNALDAAKILQDVAAGVLK